MRMEDILEKREAIKEYARQHGIFLMVLFGSRARGTARLDSDMDIAIHASHVLAPYELAQTSFDISSLFGFSGRVDIVDIGAASPLLLSRVARDGVLLFEAEPLCFARFRIYACKYFMETKLFRTLRARQLGMSVPSLP